MNLTVKRVLILFSICLNLGFLAAAAHHALYHDSFRQRRHFLTALEGVEMSDAQRKAMLALDDRLRDNMAQWRQETRHLKTDSIEAMTAEGGPDTARLTANLDEEARILRDTLGKANSIFMESLDILGREKTRQFGTALLASVDKR
ncbi:MAG: hypothetical protein AB7E47_13955 [Desulfovibrionaceae bacterium]